MSILTPLQFLTSRGRNYRQTFGGDSGQRVFNDLVRFAKIGQPFHHPDPHVRGMVEGRREVVCRIADHLNLSPEELLAKYNEGSNE